MNGKYFRGDGIWVWTAVESVSRYFLHSFVGERDEVSARYFIRGIKAKIREGHIPIFCSDGYKVYRETLLFEYGYKFTKPRKEGGGRNPVWHMVPLNGLNYGQVLKSRDGAKLISVEHRSVFGNVPKELLNTSFVERMNLTMRRSISRMARKTDSISKNNEGLEDAVDLFRSVYNLCRPHMSLTAGNKKTTPAMKMGLTDHVWTLRELMIFPYRNNINCL